MSLYLTSLLHPSQLPGQWSRGPLQPIYLKRLVDQHRAGHCFDINPEEPPPGSLLFPSPAQIEEWWKDVQAGPWDALSHDLETAGDYIICDGITPLVLGDSVVGNPICIRFYGQGGESWWQTMGDHRRVVGLLWEILRHPDYCFVGHNVVGFDLPLLLSYGFTINGPIFDTMVATSRAHSELPKGLQFLSTLYLGAPAWKKEIKEEDDGKGKY